MATWRDTDTDGVCGLIGIRVCCLIQLEANLAKVVELRDRRPLNLGMNAALEQKVNIVSVMMKNVIGSYLDDTVEQSIDVALLGVVAVELRIRVRLQLLKILNNFPQ